MKCKWGLIGGAVTLLAIMVGTAIPRTAVKETPQSLASDHVSLVSEQTQPVGWVFGRLIGFPGADRPLLPQSGSMGGSVHQPQPLSGRP